ncbi:uncharacterized protein LOC116851628 [Odontomachus brunneus]|uniref:uncharacterized protein LOC116851628 n=1 Tax=Odontomachus brunneus TaxID=486640 RepID=UPI0013F27C88|nr:uncharacterized protein LOC116851628 [Odontomachus brunneus]
MRVSPIEPYLRERQCYEAYPEYQPDEAAGSQGAGSRNQDGGSRSPVRDSDTSCRGELPKSYQSSKWYIRCRSYSIIIRKLMRYRISLILTHTDIWKTYREQRDTRIETYVGICSP